MTRRLFFFARLQLRLAVLATLWPLHAPGAIGFAVEEYRDFALSHRGNSSRGEKVFNDNARATCANCHALYGQEKCGPNLEGVGDKFGREQLIRAVLQPHAD